MASLFFITLKIFDKYFVFNTDKLYLLSQQAEELKKRSVHKGSKDQSPKNARRKRAGTVVHCDYLKRKNKSVNRRRIDPVITLSTIFEEILNEMRDMPDVQPFLFPVNAKV